MEVFLQAFIMGILTGGVYSLVALPVVLIYKSTKIFNFAQGQILLLGAWVAWAFMEQMGFPPMLSIFIALLVFILLGFLIELLALRKLIGQPILSSMIVTLCLGALLSGIVYLFWGTRTGEVYPPFIPPETLKIGFLSLSLQHVISFVIALALIGIFSLFFRYTRQGLAMRAVAEDHQVAQALGIKVTNTFRLTWIIACVLALIAGLLLGSIVGVTLTLDAIALKGFVVVLMGGLESIAGVLVAGPIVGIIEQLSGQYIDPLVGGGFMEIAPFIVLLFSLLIRPYGIFGLERIERI